MMRIIFWFCFWAITLFMIDIEVEYTDGLRIKLNGWPNAIMRALKNGEGK